MMFGVLVQCAHALQLVMNNGVIIAFDKLNKILDDIENATVTVQPGVKSLRFPRPLSPTILR